MHASRPAGLPASLGRRAPFTHVALPDGPHPTPHADAPTPVVQIPLAPGPWSGAFNTAKNTGIALLAAQLYNGSDAFSLVLARAPLHGSVAITGELLSYTPADGFEGIDTFLVTAVLPVCGGGLPLSANAAVTLTGGCGGRVRGCPQGVPSCT
jgi:hypothetical protein